jgi:RNA-directed DNA polymerase
LPLVPKAGAQCGNSARWDLRGGPPARAVPTATGAYCRCALYPLPSRINAYLVRWIRKKYKRLQAKKQALKCWRGITTRHPRMVAHWVWVPSVPRVW